MARNRVFIKATPEEVFATLSDPERYPEWVVGASNIRDFDRSFPEPGSRFHHEVGARPLTLSDHTEAIESVPPSRLVLHAKARPAGIARIEIDLKQRAGGTEVLMQEGPADRLTSLVADNPVADTLLRARNAEALSRLKRIVEGRISAPAKRRRDLPGQRVLITGGSSGVGLATAQMLAQQGADVALLARGTEGLQKARRQLTEVGCDAATFSADIRDREELSSAVDDAAARLGGIDAIIACAASSAWGPFVETPAEDFDATVETVLLGTANTIR